MDQRVKGGTPPATNSTLDTTSAPEDCEQDQVAEKKRRGEGENGEVGNKEEEKRGAGKKREGDKGAVLELLIEGRCGSTGQQQLQISGRETSCPEGNVRLRIGLQAKRTKKPPKILESYVCKPTIRTYQRQAQLSLSLSASARLFISVPLFYFYIFLFSLPAPIYLATPTPPPSLSHSPPLCFSAFVFLLSVSTPFLFPSPHSLLLPQYALFSLPD
uniref:Uncharacterized protein n=1 Tax=Mastacembelus armatus TaxID=205130 RepID=A0A3Q3M9I1_9TELE